MNAEKHFREEGTHKGQWDQLKQSTQLQRARMGYPPAHPILVRTGTLKSSIIKRTHSKHILDAHKKWMEIGTKVPYAIYHQTGTSKMAQRMMVAVDAKTFSRMIEDARRFIMDGHTGVIG